MDESSSETAESGFASPAEEHPSPRWEELQWATKRVKTLLENDAFRYLSTWSDLFASALILWYPRPRNSLLCRCCGNRKINIVWGEGEKMCQDAQKSFLSPSVSTLLSPIVVRIYYTIRSRYHKWSRQLRAVFILVSKSNWFCVYHATRLA